MCINPDSELLLFGLVSIPFKVLCYINKYKNILVDCVGWESSLFLSWTTEQLLSIVCWEEEGGIP